jgi:hypothetical protein
MLVDKAYQLAWRGAAVSYLCRGAGSGGIDGSFVMETVEVAAGSLEVLNPSLGLAVERY